MVQTSLLVSSLVEMLTGVAYKRVAGAKQVTLGKAARDGTLVDDDVLDEKIS